ncbi:MAG: DUF655 domain-containing protein [Candidatus Ranarchaeia archaeon]
MAVPQKIYEEEAIILDYLPKGYPGKRGLAISQAIGVTKFTLLELAPSENVVLGLRDFVNITPTNREVVDHVISRIQYDDLTNTSIQELESSLELVILKREPFFVEFFNTAEHVNIRLHKLELLPGIGNKLMWEIIDTRKERKFENFADISDRTSLSDPKRLIIKRIISELKGGEKYHLFVRKQKPPDQFNRKPSYDRSRRQYSRNRPEYNRDRNYPKR